MELNTENDPSRPGSDVSSRMMGTVYKSQPWYRAYMAALFESDRDQIGASIRRAELMIVSRERELFAGSLDPKEQRALNNALRALHGCLKL